MLFSSQLAVADQTSIPKSSGFSRVLQGLLGFNALAGHIGSRQLEKKLHKKLSGDFHVRLRPYSAIDLTHGVAKQLTIDGTNLIYDHALYIQSFHLETDKKTPLWMSTHHSRLKAPVEAEFSMVLTQEGINQSLQTDAMQKRLNDIKIASVQHVRVISPRITLDTNIMTVTTSVGVVDQPVDKAISVKIKTGLTPLPGSGQLQLTGFDITTPAAENTEAMSQMAKDALENFLNPTHWLPRGYRQSTVRFQSIQITPQKLVVTAHLVLVPASPLAK